MLAATSTLFAAPLELPEIHAKSNHKKCHKSKDCDSEIIYGSFYMTSSQTPLVIVNGDPLIFDGIRSKSKGIFLNTFNGEIRFDHEGDYLIAYGAIVNLTNQANSEAIELQLNGNSIPGSKFNMLPSIDRPTFHENFKIVHIEENDTLTVNAVQGFALITLGDSPGRILANITIQKLD